MSYGYISRKPYEMEIRSEIISSRERQWGLEISRDYGTKIQSEGLEGGQQGPEVDTGIGK